MKRLGTAVCCLAVLVIIWPGCSVAGGAEPPGDLPTTRPRAIAVIPLANQTGDDSLRWIGVELQETLTWSLRRVPDLRALDLQELAQRSREAPSRLAAADTNALLGLGRQLGVDIVIGGAYRGGGQQISVDLFALDIPQDKVVAGYSFLGVIGQVAPQADAALAAMAPSLHLPSPVYRRSHLGRPAGTAANALAARADGISMAVEAILGGGSQVLQAALGRLKQAVQVDPADGEVWYRLGEALVYAAQYEEARQALTRAFDIAKGEGDRILEAETLNQIGDSYIFQGRNTEAERHFGEALALARAERDWKSLAVSLHGFGSVYHQRGEHALSQGYLEQALQLARAIRHPGFEAKLLNHLAVLRIIFGEYPRAQQLLGQTVAMAQAAGDRNTERAGLNNLAVINLRQGAYREARAAFEKVLQVARSMGDRQAEALALANIGHVESLRGAYTMAQPALVGALSLSQAIGARVVEVGVFENLGTVHFLQAAYAEAQTSYEKALAVARAIKVPLLESRMLHRLGQVAGARLALDEARSFEEAALQVAQRIGDRRLEVFTLHGLGEVELARGNYAESWALLERSHQFAATLGLSEILWQTRYAMGRIDEARGAPEAALGRYREAVNVITSMARQFGESEERQAFLANKLAVYDALTRLLLQLHEQDSSKGYDQEAWAILEAKKGRLAGEALAAARPKLQDAQARGAVAQVQAKQEQVLALEKALRTEQAKPPTTQRPETIHSLTTQVAHTKTAYLAQVKAFLAHYPQYKAQFVDQHVVDPRTLAKFADELPPHTLAVQYFAAPDRLYCFVVAPGGRFQVKVQAVTQEELYGLIRQYRKYIERGATRPLGWGEDGSEEYRRDVQPLKEVTRKLAAHLLAPIEAELQAYGNLILLPNDQLLYLPIHALTRIQPDGSERFLAETHVVSYLTQQEFTSLFTAPAPSATAPLLALANPDGSLPAASREVRELRRIRPTITALDGAEATKDRFLDLAGQFPDLHLATHGILDKGRSELSYLLMAGADEESQRLGIDEIAGLRLKRGMAVLSACDTAVGEQVPGAALITLAAAFSTAGAHAIVASLWQVNDASTRDFMVAFYKALPTLGRAAALQQGQLTVLRNPATANPHYWAAFILIGAR